MQASVKQRYDFNYWFEELVKSGSALSPEKFTDDYVKKLRKAWTGQPITNLHMKVEERRKQCIQSHEK